MLSVRFARAYPERVDKLVLVAPIGLEDYRLYVPAFPADKLMEIEQNVTADSYRNQLMKGYSLTLSETPSRLMWRRAPASRTAPNIRAG
jgi:pimeloyl-ACP methyl ester carboxylesterase